MNPIFSQVESARFGLNIYRLKTPALDIYELKDLLSSKQLDILIVRLPVYQLVQLRNLNDINIDYILADTLVYYEQKLIDFKTKNVDKIDFESEIFTREKQEVISELVRKIFSGYSNHYLVNPLLRSKDINDGYVEWATSYIDLANTYSLLLKYREQYVGFITSRLNSSGEAEIVLNGILPAYQGKGIYRYALDQVREYYKRRDIGTICISTQIENVKVQNIWISEGFQLRSSFYTIHINKSGME